MWQVVLAVESYSRRNVLCTRG